MPPPARVELENAKQVFERTLDRLLRSHRGSVLQALGCTAHSDGKPDAAVPFFVEALKAAKARLLITMAAHWALAVNRIVHGDHDYALADLDRLFPLVRAVSRFTARSSMTT